METIDSESVFNEDFTSMCRQKLKKLTISDMYDLPLQAREAMVNLTIAILEQ